ncbi:hypothetical protein [Bradyrhizobium sp. USDA 4502]
MILPPDISERIEKQAKDEGKPQSRIIINDLARIPDLEHQRALAESVEDMRVLLARYSEEIIATQLTEPLLSAVDDILEVNSQAELRVKLDKLRVLRANMKLLMKGRK